MERWKELLPAPDDKMIAKLREGVEAVRDKAHAAGVTRAPKSGPVMPSLAKMVEILDEREAREAYTLAVRELNWHVHAGARTVLQERFVKRDEHSATHLPPPDYGRRALALGISVLASTLKMCAYRLGFDEESGEAEAIRLTLVPRDLESADEAFGLPPRRVGDSPPSPAYPVKWLIRVRLRAGLTASQLTMDENELQQVT